MITEKPSDDLLNRYDYATDPLLRSLLHEADRATLSHMLSYGTDINRFGLQMSAHQNRVAKDGANFLRALGFSDRAAANFRAAMLFHDIGKTHPLYDPGIWSLTDRPTPEQKALQKKHARLGADMLTDFAMLNNEFSDHPHYAVRHAVTLYHHERVDAAGPEGLDVSKLPVFVQVSCIIDAYDGDRIYRPHQQSRRTPREALARLSGADGSDKYKGAFAPDLLEKYVKMKEKELSNGKDI